MILNLDLIKFSKKIEQDLSSTIKFFPLSFKIHLGKSFVSKNSSCLIILYFSKCLHFLILLMSSFFFDLDTINLEFGIGLFGPSPPRIWNQN